MNEDFDELDDMEAAELECGMGPDGCEDAGSEHCDFDCPFRDEGPPTRAELEAKGQARLFLVK